MYILSSFDLPTNPYPEDDSVISIMGDIFSRIWTGLDQCNVPGFNFSFADLFIAMMTAILVGLVLHVGFALLGRHKGGGSSGKRSRRRGIE